MMKGFKFGLVAILLGLFGLTCFSYGDYSFTYPSRINLAVPSYGNSDIVSGGVCIFSSAFTNFNIYKSDGNLLIDGSVLYNSGVKMLCTVNDIYFHNKYSSPTTVYIMQGNYYVDMDLPVSTPSCDYSGYVAVDDITTNYCVSNDLCPVSSGVSWSELVINDIVHQSAPLINITIPEGYSWDYSVDENEFTLDISGANVDYAYIDGIIRTQKGKPNSIDFNNVITGLIPLLVPGLVIILFIWFIFRFIKKIF